MNWLDLSFYQSRHIVTVMTSKMSIGSIKSVTNYSDLMALNGTRTQAKTKRMVKRATNARAILSSNQRNKKRHDEFLKAQQNRLNEVLACP